MHEAGDGGQVGSCSSEALRGNQYLGRVRTLTTTASARTALDDYRHGETVVCKGALAATNASAA